MGRRSVLLASGTPRQIVLSKQTIFRSPVSVTTKLLFPIDEDFQNSNYTISYDATPVKVAPG